MFTSVCRLKEYFFELVKSEEPKSWAAVTQTQFDVACFENNTVGGIDMGGWFNIHFSDLFI